MLQNGTVENLLKENTSSMMISSTKIKNGTIAQSKIDVSTPKIGVGPSDQMVKL